MTTHALAIEDVITFRFKPDTNISGCEAYNETQISQLSPASRAAVEAASSCDVRLYNAAVAALNARKADAQTVAEFAAARANATAAFVALCQEPAQQKSRLCQSKHDDNGPFLSRLQQFYKPTEGAQVLRRAEK